MSEHSRADKSHKITALLQGWRAGNFEAGTELMDLVYSELHRMAGRLMRRERQGHTLQATALVHELYVRLCRGTPIHWRDRSQFFAVAALQLRRVLVDHARRFRSEKRGGAAFQVTLEDFDGSAMQFDEGLLAVDEALEQLKLLDERAAKVVELRFFGGLNEAETAEILNVSVATLRRDWDFARTWLASRLM
jgi:RNA polymerase sigma-70 factor (ECF subfamily)